MVYAVENEDSTTERVLSENEIIIAQNEEILSILRPLAQFVAEDLPRLSQEAGPIIEGIKRSPVLKMIGVTL